MSSTFKNWTSDNYAFVGKAFDFAYADRLNKLSTRAVSSAALRP